jgi:opine dehydrogenase
MRVAVLGGSHRAYRTAADLGLAGHQVRLWAEGQKGLPHFERLTADLPEALADAEVVIVPLPATAHQDVARRLAKHLGPRQIVLLTPGTFGAYVMAREIEQAGGRQPFAFAETGTFPYRAGKTEPADAASPIRAENLPTGAFPAVRSSEVLARLGVLFPSIRPCRDALDAALTNRGTVMHPALVLLNTGAIEGGHFDIRASGATPGLRRLIEAADRERVEIRQRLGYPAPHDGQAREVLAAEGLGETFTFEHPYVSEDVGLGLPLFESAGRLANVETPTVSGLLSVFEALLGRDLRRQGRALDRLGLGELTLREIRSLLQEGWLSPMWRRVC